MYIFWIKETNTYHPNYRIWVICLSIKIKTKLNKPQIPSIVEIKGHRRLERRGGGALGEGSHAVSLALQTWRLPLAKTEVDTAIHWINLNSLERNHLSLYLSSIALFVLYSWMKKGCFGNWSLVIGHLGIWNNEWPPNNSFPMPKATFIESAVYGLYVDVPMDRVWFLTSLS